MRKEEIINGKLFITQTTYYIYRNEDELQNNKPPMFITSSEKEFNRHKENERSNIDLKLGNYCNRCLANPCSCDLSWPPIKEQDRKKPICIDCVFCVKDKECSSGYLCDKNGCEIDKPDTDVCDSEFILNN